MVVLVDREEGRGLERRGRGEVKEQQGIVEEEDYQRVDCQHMELREIRNTEPRTRENDFLFIVCTFSLFKMCLMHAILLIMG